MHSTNYPPTKPPRYLNFISAPHAKGPSQCPYCIPHHLTPLPPPNALPPLIHTPFIPPSPDFHVSITAQIAGSPAQRRRTAASARADSDWGAHRIPKALVQHWGISSSAGTRRARSGGFYDHQLSAGCDDAAAVYRQPVPFLEAANSLCADAKKLGSCAAARCALAFGHQQPAFTGALLIIGRVEGSGIAL